MLTQDFIQPVVKRIAGSLDYGARCDPDIALPVQPFRVPIAMQKRRSKQF